MKNARYLVAVVLAVSLIGCSFETVYDSDVYWRCDPQGECPGWCNCLEGRFCVPDNKDMSPGDCAWCPDNQADCNNQVSDGCEANLVHDPNHCGECAAGCATVQFCEFAACVDACRPGLTQCGRSCIDTSSDLDNCGGCDQPCQPNQVCSRGECKSGCAEDLTLCNGRCVDTDSDPANCNHCGNLCRFENAFGQCTDGTCQIRQCIEPFADCNSDPVDGCEADLTSDSAHCGSCTTPCTQVILSSCIDSTQRKYPSGVVSCEESECVYEMAIEVCEHGCVAGRCRGDICGSGRCDPDENCIGGVCYCGSTHNIICTPTEFCCIDSCVDLQNDSENCNVCGKSCGQNSICAAGKCECDSTHENCDLNWATGCETDTSDDSDNCGDCGIVCPQNSHCLASDCHCYTNFDNCDNNWEGTGCETDLNLSNDHCSECNNSCGANANCKEGACGCQEGFDNCDGNWNTNGCEADLMNDPNNCDYCGRICGFGPCCDGDCPYVLNDPAHCGECDNVCVGDFPCVGGHCGVEGVICGGETCNTVDSNICCFDSDNGSFFCTNINGCEGGFSGLACDGPEDCQQNQSCCFNIDDGLLSQCRMSPCSDYTLCSSDTQCLENDNGRAFCCEDSINDYWIYLCRELPCD
ncbi:MAG: hypothetical protein JRJ87_12880 [Deltaproteobacteria bacterium]|nr:hypothetical protein [Deltaproteobacteria bacterium]